MTAAIAIDPGEHIVQFYDDEPELARTVGRYLSETVEAGAAGIVIATDAHRRAFAGQLAAAEIDVAKCVLDGTLTLLDAAATMAQFVRDGRVDRQAFRRVIGSMVGRAGATGRPVRAYGEMVALLWEAGDVVAAIELEECWNELSREFPFALLCGYHSESVLGHEHAEALRQVCAPAFPGSAHAGPRGALPSRGGLRPLPCGARRRALRASIRGRCAWPLGPCRLAAGQCSACRERVGDQRDRARPLSVLGRGPGAGGGHPSVGSRCQRSPTDDARRRTTGPVWARVASRRRAGRQLGGRFGRGRKNRVG